MSHGLRSSAGAGVTGQSGVLAVTAPPRWQPSLFGVVPAGSVRRRPGDVVQLILGLLLIAVCFAVTNNFAARPDDVYSDLTDLPDWIIDVSTWLFLICSVGAVLVIVGALLISRNFALALTLVGVGAVAAVVAFAVADLIDVDAVRQAAGSNTGPLSAGSIVWLAVATGVLLAAAPYLVRPARRIVTVILTLAVIGAVFAAIGPIPSILIALGIGWVVSAATSLVLGTPRATPSQSSVETALVEFGLVIDQLTLADVQSVGETRFVGVAPDGSPASVVVIGRDASNARLFRKMITALVYRDSGPAVSVSRSAQLEHRAYLLLMAARAGVPVSDVVIAVRGGSRDMAVLALLEPVGEPLSTIVPGAITDATLDDAWTKAARLHASRLTHGQLVPANVIVDDDGSVALVDFSQGSAGAPPERCERDLADLLSTTSALVGIERAIDAAMRSLGRDRLEELLPLLATPALSPAARRAVPGSKKHLKALRAAGAERCGIDVPDLTELRRVSPGSIVMAAATFLGFYLIVAQFAGVDLWATLSEADLSWVAVAFALSFIPQFSGAIALMGCVSHPLPFRPVLAEQFANNFTGLIGGTVATTALVIRFFQKQGLKVAVAVSSGVMNSLASSIVQLVLVTIGLLFTSTQFVPSSVGGGDLEQIILIGIVVLGVAVTIAMLVPRLRAALRRVIAPQYASARDNVRGILKDPRRAVMIFGGNLCSQVTYALVIDAALHAYGASLPLLQIIVINSLASLLGGMAPVPGGMGVIEAGLIAGMTAAGIEQEIAVAATFTARLFTAYLPPIWGWVSLRWLRRHDYV